MNKGALSAILANWPSVGTRDRNSRRQLRLQEERGPQDAPLGKLSGNDRERLRFEVDDRRLQNKTCLKNMLDIGRGYDATKKAV